MFHLYLTKTDIGAEIKELKAYIMASKQEFEAALAEVSSVVEAEAAELKAALVKEKEEFKALAAEGLALFENLTAQIADLKEFGPEVAKLTKLKEQISGIVDAVSVGEVVDPAVGEQLPPVV